MGLFLNLGWDRNSRYVYCGDKSDYLFYYNLYSDGLCVFLPITCPLFSYINMKIYTGQTTGEKLEKIKELELGIMISSNPNTAPSKVFSEVPCALDNGAFVCYSKGYGFQSDVFLETLRKCYKLGISLDFIVCPDIICGGLDSLSFSIKWANGKLFGYPRLALVLQDGMGIKDIRHYHLTKFTHLFVGGSVEWKWKTAKDWIQFAHDNNKECHIGQCGKLEYLEQALRLGADSVDSTSITRNDSWHIIEQFNNKLRLEL